MLTYTLDGDTAVVNLDDGKANAVGHNFVDAVNEGLDRASGEAKAVVISGRSGVFSAGFDLKEFEKGAEATQALVGKGANMLLRLFRHPQPIVMACAGHAVAAGAFMLLSGDTRIGTQGDFKIGLNETAIGMTLPTFGLQLASARISKRYLTQATIQAQLFSPDQAQDVGFFDEVVNADQLMETALQRAATLAQLPGAAYAQNKLDVRQSYIKTIEDSLA